MEERNGVWVTAVKGCCCAMLPWPVHSDETCLPFQQSEVKCVSAESIPGEVIARVMIALSHINRHTQSQTQIVCLSLSVSVSAVKKWLAEGHRVINRSQTAEAHQKVTPNQKAVWENTLCEWQKKSKSLSHLSAFVQELCFISTDSSQILLFQSGSFCIGPVNAVSAGLWQTSKSSGADSNE